MANATSYQVGARVPKSIVQFMDNDIANGNFMNRSDWIGCACREFMKMRQKEIAESSQDTPGGGVSKKSKLTGNARQCWITAYRVTSCIC